MTSVLQGHRNCPLTCLHLGAHGPKVTAEQQHGVPDRNQKSANSWAFYSGSHYLLMPSRSWIPGRERVGREEGEKLPSCAGLDPVPRSRTAVRTVMVLGAGFPHPLHPLAPRTAQPTLSQVRAGL